LIARRHVQSSPITRRGDRGMRGLGRGAGPRSGFPIRQNTPSLGEPLEQVPNFSRVFAGSDGVRLRLGSGVRGSGLRPGPDEPVPAEGVTLLRQPVGPAGPGADRRDVIQQPGPFLLAGQAVELRPSQVIGQEEGSLRCRTGGFSRRGRLTAGRLRLRACPEHMDLNFDPATGQRRGNKKQGEVRIPPSSSRMSAGSGTTPRLSWC
jgi:hypothetical protein